MHPKQELVDAHHVTHIRLGAAVEERFDNVQRPCQVRRGFDGRVAVPEITLERACM